MCKYLARFCYKVLVFIVFRIKFDENTQMDLCFSSPENNVLKLSYWDHRVSDVRRQHFTLNEIRHFLLNPLTDCDETIQE